MNNLFNIQEGHFTLLLRSKLSLDHIYVLEKIINDNDVDEELYLPVLQRLERKGYIDRKGIITQYGKNLYDSFYQEVITKIKIKKPRQVNDKFEEWWLVYPSTNHFEINGRLFKGSQSKKTGKEECKKLFSVMCNGEFTAEDIIQGTQYHIDTAKEISYKKGENQLTYIPNSLRYIREKRFEGYITISKQKIFEVKSVDI